MTSSTRGHDVTATAGALDDSRATQDDDSGDASFPRELFEVVCISPRSVGRKVGECPPPRSEFENDDVIIYAVLL